MLKHLRQFFLLLPLLCLVAPSQAANEKISADELMASLHFEQGKIELPGKLATLNLPANFRYLPPPDAERLLVQGWGNPSGNESLGMIVPTELNPLSKDGWGVIISFERRGYVKDDDADSIKYDELLKEMQEAVKEHNTERKQQGYPEMALIGWAETPRYDKASNKLYWAKEIGITGQTEHTLNYNVRVLGRNGVLNLNAVAGMNQIGQIKGEMQQVIGFTEFTAGNRYADFNASTDKVAEYGIAALVAGGVAAKLGFFGKFFAILLAFKKLLFLALAGIGAFVMKLFGSKKAD
jgi:uncharacterized membrane-anchored protein